MTALFVKELRQLRPIGFLWLVLMAFGYLALVLGERIDETTFSSWCADYCNSGTDYISSSIYVVLFLIIAYSLFPREHDEATIDFLHSLPVSRRTIFLVKFLSAWTLATLMIVLTYGIDSLILSVNDQSLLGHSYPVVRATMMVREILFAFIILAHGVFLSRFRSPGLILYAVYLLGLMWAESRFGSSGLFNVLQVMHNEYRGQTLLLDWQAISVHLVVAIIFLFYSYWLWNNQESRSSEGRAEKSGMRWPAVVLTVIVFFVATAIMSERFRGGSFGDAEEGIKKATTEFYRFTYPEKRESTFKFIVANADEDYRALQALLGSSNEPHIQADLTAQSDHAIGLARWKKIKVDLSGFSDDLFYRRVLSHETVHVFQSVESNRKLVKNAQAARFFIEGMAQYASFAVVADEEARQSNWHLAAVAWSRQDISFQKLLNDLAFTSEYDVELYYTLGDIWTYALVQTCGEGVLGNILRTLTREDTPQYLNPDLFWRSTLQQVSCELDSVNAAMRNHVEELIDEKGTEQFPLLTNVTSQYDKTSDRIKISADAETAGEPGSSGTVPERFYLKVRNSSQPSPEANKTFTGKLEKDHETGKHRVTWLLPTNVVTRERYDIQLGFLPQPGSRIYFQPWQTGNL